MFVLPGRISISDFCFKQLFLNTVLFMKRFASSLLVLVQFFALVNSANIRVTCIGDSITEGGSCGVGSYVDKLQSILGDNYSVYNAGASGMTMLKKGTCDEHMNSTCSYWDTNAWSQAQESYPDIVTIMLGTNDAKAFNWETIQQSTGDYYALDYVELVQKVQAFKSNPKIYVMVPPPLRSPYPYLMNATINLPHARPKHRRCGGCGGY